MNDPKANTLSLSERLQIKIRASEKRDDDHKYRATNVGAVVALTIFIWAKLDRESTIAAAIVAALFGWGVKALYKSWIPLPRLDCHFCKSPVRPNTKICPTCNMDINDMVPES